MRRNQAVIHVARVAGCVAQTRNAGNARKAEQQFAKAPFAAILAFAMPGIDVLASKVSSRTPLSARRSASATICFTLRETSEPRATGHHAESAELSRSLPAR